MWVVIAKHEMPRWFCAVLAVVLAATACYGAPVDRVGAPTQAAVSLRLANALWDEELLEFFQELESRSDGRYDIEPGEETSGQPDVEEKVIEDVRAGRADIGAVGARAISTLGVRTYEPLIAPFMVDSYELQAEVLGDQELVDQMGSGMEAVGLVGIGIVAGPLRYLASREPMTKPADFAGKRVALLFRSAVGQETFDELGATTGDLAAGGALDGFDAVEAQLSVISIYGYGSVPAIHADLALWPRAIVVFMTRERYEQLGAEGQSLLRDAVSASVGDRARSLKSLQDEVVGILCRRGHDFVTWSPEDAASMRAGVDAVLGRISSDEAAKAVLERIQALKTSVEPAAAPRCAPSLPPSTPAATQLDGSWQACPTVEDILAAGGEPGEAEGNAGCTTWTFSEGTFTESGSMAISSAAGSYEVDGDVITVWRANGEEFIFRWSIFRGRLTFADRGVAGAYTPAPVLAVPWERVSD